MPDDCYWRHTQNYTQGQSIFVVNNSDLNGQANTLETHASENTKTGSLSLKLSSILTLLLTAWRVSTEDQAAYYI